jgi:ABC-type uncharacterized transport system permease subunit
MGYIIKFEERELRKYMYVLSPTIAIGLAFLLGAGLMLWAGVSPLDGYSAFLIGALGSPQGFIDTLLRMTPFLFMGVGIAFSNRASVLNIGAEGQYIVGAIAATWVTILLQNAAPSALSVTAAIVMAALIGGLWALFAAVLKAYLGINEIITTVIMNWLAFRLLQWLLRGPLKNPEAQQWPMSPPLTATLPALIPGTRLHVGFLLALLLAIILYYVMFRTNVGFKLRVTGENPDVATYAGYDVVKYILISMAISGGMAGLAGSVEVLGVFKFLYEGIAVGLGYTAIIVALVGKNHPLGVIFSAFMFGIIYNGMTYLQAATGLTYTFSKSLEGLIYIFVLIVEVFVVYRVRLIKVEGVGA